MRLESAEYDGGRVYLDLGKDTVEYPFEPSIIFPSFVLDLLPEPVEGKKERNDRFVRVTADFDYLVELHRTTSKITSAVLFLPPERQFLLSKGISYGTEFVDRMPVLRFPYFETVKDALSYLLRSRRGNPPRIFVENAYYLAGVAADLSFAERNELPPEALRIFLEVNFSTVVLPSSPVRLRLSLPVALRSPNARRTVSYRDGDVAPLVDALLLGADHEILLAHRVDVSIIGVLQRAVSSLLGLATRMLSRTRVSGKNIWDYALHSTSPSVLSAYAYLGAVAEILLPLPAFLASTNALTPLGRKNFYLLWYIFLREPNAYKRLYANNPICSQDLNALEYFLRVLSSLPLEHRLSSRYLRQ